jgi:hypothetical protein
MIEEASTARRTRFGDELGGIVVDSPDFSSNPRRR